MKKILILIAVYPIILGLLYLFQDQLIFHEKSLKNDFKYSFTIPFQEIWLKPETGISINAIHFKTASATKKGIVVYFHGNADNLVRWGKHAGDFTRNGYDVLMIDYRGFGKSNGKFSEKGLLLDAETAYNYAKKVFPEQKIVVYGRSLGTGIATKIASENNPKMLLLETPYLSFPDLIDRLLPMFPVEKLIHYQFNTGEVIGKVKCPIHLFHGTDDGLVYYESSLKLAKILKKNPNQILTTIQDGEHKNLSEFPQYHIALDSCLAN